MKYGRFSTIFLICLNAGLISGCGTDYKFSLTGMDQSFNQSGSKFNNQVDVLWVVDNSSSMAPLQANMTANFNSFISNFQSQGYDFRMAVTTTDAYKANPNFIEYDPSNAPLSLFQDGAPGTAPSGVFIILPMTPGLDNVFLTNATTGDQGSGDERAFSSLMTSMTNSANPSFLRTNSFLAVIILSDEDDFSSFNRGEGSWGNNNALDHCYVDPTMDALATTAYSGSTHIATCANQTPPDSVASYIQDLDQLTTSTGVTRRYNVSAITVLDSACQLQHSQVNSDSFVSIIGQRYMQLAQGTQGVTGSICDPSYANSLSAIAQQIIVLSTQFFLNTLPNPSSITVTVNGVTVPQDATNGWTYVSAANSIQFHGSAVPAQDAVINVAFIPAAAN